MKTFPFLCLIFLNEHEDLASFRILNDQEWMFLSDIQELNHKIIQEGLFKQSFHRISKLYS